VNQLKPKPDGAHTHVAAMAQTGCELVDEFCVRVGGDRPGRKRWLGMKAGGSRQSEFKQERYKPLDVASCWLSYCRLLPSPESCLS
jgi:hypothetical protein